MTLKRSIVLKKTTAAFAITLCLVFMAGCSKDKTAASSALSSDSSNPLPSASAIPASPVVDSSSAISSGAESPEIPSNEELSETVKSDTQTSGAKAGEAQAKNPSPGTAKATPQEDVPNEPEKAETVTVTIPEGYTLARIASKLEAKGICKEADFIKAAQTQSFSSYPLVAAMPKSSHRAYKLEGYLYPDTYEFYKDMNPKLVIQKFLANAERKINGKYRYSGMTIDQIVTLASIIEKEADTVSDMKMVSAIFHNRLKKGIQLQADATITYCTYCLLPPNGPFADEFKYYYNTYRCKDLPAGPICNPGANALNAAANPTKTDYLYFITKDGKYYYQKTLDEHKAKLKELGMKVYE
jgi:UPF0755 protein